MSRKTGMTWTTMIGLWTAVCVSGPGCFHHREQVIPMPPPGAIPSELHKVMLPTYRIEPPDVLLIDVYLPPKEVLDPPVGLWPQPITGQHLVRIDGTVGLGTWGSVPLAGLTLDEAAEAIRHHVFDRIKNSPTIQQSLNEASKEKDAPKDGKKERAIQLVDRPEKLLVAVDVLSYNSKTYYIITDGAGYGEQIYSFPITGNDTVLQALSNINGLPYLSSKRNIWLARRTPVPNVEQIFPVDYVALTQHAITETNYQVLPGDRIYLKSERIFRVDYFLQKFLTPVERVLGVTLLGSSTYYSIKGTNVSGTTP